MPSRSSSSSGDALLPVGRVRGRRGNSGEITVLVHAGDAAYWQGVTSFRIETDAASGRFYDVEQSRSYRDRLVLKLQGIDDAGAAQALRGGRVLASADQAPALPEGEYHIAQLTGLRVLDETGRELGTVRDVATTSGTDLLLVTPAGEPAANDPDSDLMIPLASEIVLRVALDEGWIRVRLPAGLLGLNRDDAEVPR